MEQVQVYPVEELKQHSKVLFGVNPEVMAGALHSSDKKEFAVEELRELIKTFLQRKVEG
ncbi:MAG: hypothetical protein HPY50_04960 [Firmicutes bacterium]|nr:hypothetical protein [Bacillota bacterium]